MKFDYDDINLIPRYSTVDSRSECDISFFFGKQTLENEQYNYFCRTTSFWVKFTHLIYFFTLSLAELPLRVIQHAVVIVRD